MTPLRRFLLIFAVPFADVELALADQHTWSGCHFGSPVCNSPTPAWTDARNWFEGAPHTGPNVADDLVFANTAMQAITLNTFDAGTRFRSITIGATHQLQGAAITLDAGITASASAIIQLPITLNARQAFNVSTAGAGLTFQGATITTNNNILDVFGPGNILMISPLIGDDSVSKTGTGTLQFVGNHPFTGLIAAFEGTVRIAGNHSGPILVDGGRFEGAGSVRGISSLEGPPAFVIAPGGTSPNETAIINCVGDLIFRGPGTFAVQLKGTTAGSGYDQLNVTGGVSILSSVQRPSLAVELVNFTPSPGDSFIIVNNDGTDPIQGGSGSPAEFLGGAEGSPINFGGLLLFVTYHGGDGNDIMLHVPTTRTWDGGGSDNKWSTAANWVGDVAPAVGDDLVFPAGAAQLNNVNDLPAGTLFGSITMQALYILSGNAIALQNGIVSTAPSGNSGVLFDAIALTADQSFLNNGLATFFVNSPILTNGRRLTVAGGNQSFTVQMVLSGEISGSGGLTVQSGIACRLDGGGSGNPKANTYTGATILTGGFLIVRAAQPQSPIQISGGRLSGQGQLGPVTATGGTIRPQNGVPTTLAVSGNLSLSSGSEFSPEIISNASPPGQLSVTGQVSLGNATLNFQDVTQGTEVPAVGDKILILLNDGADAVSGTFNGLPEGATFVSFGRLYSITYQGGDGNDVAVSLVSAAATRKLGNISTRLRVETGDNALIGGFILTGPFTKRILIRALGPSIPLSGTLADPILELRSSSGSLIRSNDSWKSTQRSQIEETGIPPTNDLEAAIVATLDADNSAYTAIVRGVNDGTGVGLVEIYDLEINKDAKLANISTRGLVQTGNDILIAGTIMVGPGTQKVLIRAIGPSLPLNGKLANPTLELRDQNGGLIEANDDWINSPNKQAIIDSTIPPTNDLESAIVATLPANNASYTALVRGVNDTTGIAVVEIYALN